MSSPSKAPESLEASGLGARTPSASDELSRLRHTSALNSEILASLRALREREIRCNAEQAALLAAVTGQLESQWKALYEQISSGSVPGLMAEAPSELLEDLHEYTQAWAGTLTLEREPVHLGRLLRQALAQAGADRGWRDVQARIEIQQEVPERVLTDARHLSKVLVHLIGAALDGSASEPSALLIELKGAETQGPEDQAGYFVFAVKAPLGAVVKGADRGELSEAAALRAALVERLCEHLGGSIKEESSAAGWRRWDLTLALEASEDPVQAGELERAGVAPVSASDSPHAAQPSGTTALSEASPAPEGAIDFMYLDRQLGSLAQLVLARTAPAFLELADERLTTLVVAQQLADHQRIRDLAQAWKASAMSVGGRSLAGLLGSLEKQAAAGHVPGEGAFRQIGNALERLKQSLRDFGSVPRNSA